MTINSSSVTATVPSLSLTLEVVDVSITLDEYRRPYGEAQITVISPGLGILDPREARRVVVVYEDEQIEPTPSTTTRTFDLYLHASEIDDRDPALERLTLVTDEALLIDRGHRSLTIDKTLIPLGPSLRAVVNNILARVGASLEAGSADADYTAIYDATNRLITPSVESANVSRWVIRSGSAVGVRSTASARTGTASYRVTASAAGDSSVSIGYLSSIPAGIEVDAEGMYKLSAWIRTTGTGRACTLKVIGYNASGVSLGFLATLNPLVTGFPQSVTSSTTWQEMAVVVDLASAPLVAQLAIVVEISSAANAQIHYIDDAAITDVYDTDIIRLYPPYFDGDTPDDTHYSYAWTGVANESTSTRTRLVARDPDALALRPGQLYWDYLDNFIEPAGLRLFCDEARDWYLVDDSSFTVAGSVNATTGTNVTEGRTEASLRSDWADSVLVTYQWADDEGKTHTQYDLAGSGTVKMLPVDKSAPYPGPGAAAAILARSIGKGRLQDIKLLTKLSATPGQAIATALASAPEQAGVLSAVTFGWAVDGNNSDEMVVRPRDLEDA